MRRKKVTTISKKILFWYHERFLTTTAKCLIDTKIEQKPEYDVKAKNDVWVDLANENSIDNDYHNSKSEYGHQSLMLIQSRTQQFVMDMVLVWTKDATFVRQSAQRHTDDIEHRNDEERTCRDKYLV